MTRGNRRQSLALMGLDILTEIGPGDRIEALIEAGVVRVDGVAAG